MSGESIPTGAIKQVRGARASLAAVADSVDDAAIGNDLEDTIIFWNPAAVMLFG